MQDSDINSDGTCLLCCEERDMFILPKCNHKDICWRCCINMIKEGKFKCPFCKSSANQREKIIFVTLQHMLQYSYNQMLKTPKIELLKSQKNSNYYYSSQAVAEKIEYQTSYNCPFQQCQQLLDSLNQLKKHLDLKHKKQYCDICLTNRKCIQSQQILYSENQYQKHVKNGEFSQNGDLILYHPTCTFCKHTFYDIDEFRRHLEHTHEKCFICHKNSEELKYVYFDNYEQAVQHFKKSHFYCETSTCMGTKFENVFLTEEALQQHVLRVHRKVKASNKPIMDMMLGFHKNDQQSGLEWDKTGKNFSNIFRMVEKNNSPVNLKPVQHEDLKIDIRDFYAQQCKRTMNISLLRIKEKIQDRRYEMKYNQSQLYIDDVDFFKPLEMQPLTKVQLERFLHGVFEKKVCDPIINKFFAGRQDFSTVDQYFAFVRDKMRSSSKIAFYYSFPQLVRFFKNENPHKALMDEFYYETLRDLKVKRPFIIHTKEKYSEVLFFMKELIEKELQERDEDSQRAKKELDVDKYVSFLKETNQAYFVKNQEDIFYVSKQKITNLYHMINKCRVQDFLKMNWLLKIGFSNDAYKIILKQFYYREQNQCYHAVKKFNIQELAYLYAYCTICLEAIFQKNVFKKNKEKPSPLFLTNILGRIKKSSTHQRLREIVELEKKFHNTDHHINYKKEKGILINAEEHPSLLDRNIDVVLVPFKSKPPEQPSDFPTIAGFGTIRPKIWNQPSPIVNSSNNKKVGEDYPSLMPISTKKQEKKLQEEQFPVFHYVGKKNKKQKALNAGINLTQVVGWGGSKYISNKWSQQVSIKNWQKRQEDEKRRIQRHEQIQKEMATQKKTEPKQPPKPIIQESSKTIIQESPKKKEKEKKKYQQPPTVVEPPKPIPQQPMVFVVSKKSHKIDEQEQSFQPTKKKNKQKKKDQPTENKGNIPEKAEDKKKQKTEDEYGLFEKIQKESEIVSKKQKKQLSKPQKIIDASETTKNQQKQKVPSKNFYMTSNVPSEFFQKDEFPVLAPVKNNQKEGNQKPSTNNGKPSPQEKTQKPKQNLPKKRKMRVDDTSSQQEQSRKQEQSKKQENKKQEEFVSISQKFNKLGDQKVSIVNQIIQSAKVQQKPQNLVQIKRNKKGKKEIVESVNLANWW